MDLAVQMLDGADDRVEGFVGAVPEKGRALLQELGRQAVQVQLLFRQTGQQSPPQQHCRLGGQGGHPAQHAGAVGGVGFNRPDGKQGRFRILAAEKSGGDFFIPVDVEDAGEKAGRKQGCQW